jgi:FKBP-type peptidyl-prolyl cis-trans isomerase
MNLKQQLMLLATAGVLAAGCGADYKKTKEGLSYKIFSTGKGEKIKPGQLLKINFKSEVGDSVLFSTFEHIPAYGKYDTTVQAAYDFIDFLGEMNIGDSAVYVRSVDTLQKKGMLQYGGAFKKGGTIKGYLKVISAFKDEAAMGVDHEKEVEIEKQREIAGLEKFVKEKGGNAQKTPGGVLVVMEKEGTGAPADSGMKVTVNYTGYLKNGKKFDSNMDSSFQHVKPYEFIVAAHQVIPGWDEGIRLFKAGGKGKMYVPAMLAYGPQSQGERMPAFSDLVFDIELLEVSTPAAPPAGSMQQPGGIPPGQ